MSVFAEAQRLVGDWQRASHEDRREALPQSPSWKKVFEQVCDSFSFWNKNKSKFKMTVTNTATATADPADILAADQSASTCVIISSTQ